MYSSIKTDETYCFRLHLVRHLRQQMVRHTEPSVKALLETL